MAREISGCINGIVKFLASDSAGSLLFFCMHRMYEKEIFKEIVSYSEGGGKRLAGRKIKKIFLNARKRRQAQSSGFRVLRQAHPAGPV